MVKKKKLINSKKFFIRRKNGKPIILMSMTDCVQIQSVTASLSYECIAERKQSTINSRDRLNKYFNANLNQSIDCKL